MRAARCASRPASNHRRSSAPAGGRAELLLDRIPLAKAIYGSVKKLIAAFQTTGGEAQRVVLISFPSEEMKAVGLVTRTVLDRDTGEELVVVYVPTSPNPTSGYIEIVPVSRVVPTDWTLDEAMRFIISGGSSAAADIHFRLPPSSLGRKPPTAVRTKADATDEGPTDPPRGERR